MITKNDYIEFKPYWDYQRKVQYNKELLKEKIESIRVSFEFHEGVDLPLDEMYDEMWDNLEIEEYEDPPKAWIPKDEDYQVEGEASGQSPELL